MLVMKSLVLLPTGRPKPANFDEVTQHPGKSKVAVPVQGGIPRLAAIQSLIYTRDRMEGGGKGGR